MDARIYTRRGDKGETSLVGGRRVAKNSLRVKAYGEIDETNSHVALAAAAVTDDLLIRALRFVQHKLYNCAANLAAPPGAPAVDRPVVTKSDVRELEWLIDFMTHKMGTIDVFILPGGVEAAARLHVARAVARRAERTVFDLAGHEQVDESVLSFMNRLSDLLFTAARYANYLASVGDVVWDPEVSSEH